jgi:hypothetical protein
LEYRSPGGEAIDEKNGFSNLAPKSFPFFILPYIYKNIHVKIYYMPKLNYEKKLKAKALVDQASSLS